MADQDAAPDVTGPAPDASTLGNIVSQAPTQQPILAGNGANGLASQDDMQMPMQGGSRLTSILSAVAHVATVGLSGIPAGNRPSFLGGLGQGARASLADQAQQQDIKFKTFNDSLRAANLHGQDIQKQQADADQQAAQQAAEDFQREAFTNNGGSYETHPNDGTAVTQTLQAQTQANGSATIAPGTHVSANGTDILMPSNDPQSLSAQVKGYQSLQGVLPGLPTLPAFDPSSVKTRADVVKARQDLGQHIDIMQHLLQGYNIDGSPLNHGQLKDLIPAYQAQIDSLTKNGKSTPYQLGTLKNTLAILQANESNHQDAEDQVADTVSQRKIAETNAINDNKAGNTEDVNDNKPQKAAKVDTNMYVGSDATGNQIAGTAADLQAAGAQGVTKLDADTGKKVITARTLIAPSGLFSQISQDISSLDAKGKLGTAADARFHAALLGTAGSDPDYAPLIAHTHLLATALMQAHVGSKGSENMMNEFKSLADAGKMSRATLVSALGAEYNYVHEKAMMPKKQAPSGGQ